MVTIFEDTGGFGLGRALWVSSDEKTIFYPGSGIVKKWTKGSGIDVYTDGLSGVGNLTVDPGGNLVVTARGAHRVYRVANDGTKTVIAGDGSTDEPVNGRLATEIGLEDARGVAFRPDGSFFVCAQKGGDVVFVDTKGIANIFVSGRRNQNAHDGDGKPPESPGDKISEPRAVALSPNGDVIITTNDNGFIRVVKAIPPPRSVSLRPEAGSGTVLSWEADEQLQVVIESSTDLKSWLKHATADEGVAEFQVGGAVVGSRYYRLRSRRN
jgi:WD40 repeat protein